jgi:hypothetical protein
MTARFLVSLALAALLPASASAQASLVAGWDFSQYAGDGFMSVDDGASFTNVLSANYSDLDPTFGAGFESAAFGTMYADGSFGSTPVAAGSGSEEFLPSAAVGGSLVSNLGAPSQVDFDAWPELLDEGGQISANSLSMIAPSAASVVFEANLSGTGEAGSNWSVSFGARTFSGTSSVAVEFSSDGVAFDSLGSVNLSTVDSLYVVPLSTESSDRAYVRFSFAPVGTDQPLIDNLAILAELSGSTTTTTTTSTTTTTTSTTAPPTTTTTTSTTAPPTTTTTTSTTAPPTTTTAPPTTTTAPPATTTTTSTTAPPTTTTSTAPPTTSTTTTTSPTTTSTTTTTLPSGKVAVCHKGKRTVSVGVRAVRAHLRHGDSLGACE